MSNPVYFYFGDGEKVVGRWNARKAVQTELWKFLTFCSRYITYYPLGRPRSGGADPLWIAIETLEYRLNKREIEKLEVGWLGVMIISFIYQAKNMFKILEKLYRPTIYAELTEQKYYGENRNYINLENKVHSLIDWFCQQARLVDEPNWIPLYE